MIERICSSCENENKMNNKNRLLNIHLFVEKKKTQKLFFFSFFFEYIFTDDDIIYFLLFLKKERLNLNV